MSISPLPCYHTTGGQECNGTSLSSAASRTQPAGRAHNTSLPVLASFGWVHKPVGLNRQDSIIGACRHHAARCRALFARAIGVESPLRHSGNADDGR